MNKFAHVFMLNVAGLSAILSSSSVLASSHAHQHGHAELNVAQIGEELVFELDSPLMNFTGFEHQPENAEQEAIINRARKALGNPQNLFVLPQLAECQVQAQEPALPNMEGHDDRHEEEHKGEHEKEHENEHHEGEEHHEDEEHHHMDVEISYTFHCAKPELLQQIDIQLFSQFPYLQNIQVQWLTEQRQGVATLTPTEYQLALLE